MKVNVANLKLEAQILEKLISDYENNYQNIYTIFNELTNYWIDGNSKVFFDDIAENKNKIIANYQELISIYNIYKFIIENYETFGEKLEFNLDYKDKVLDKFDYCLNILERINNKINQIDVSFCQSKENFYNAEQILKESNLISKNIKYKIKNSMEIIEEIEKKVYRKIDNIDINILKEDDL